jgi:UDP-glucuronate decarboxylase
MINNQEKYINFIKKNLKDKEIPHKKKILITGCSGFIGYYLVKCLADIFGEKKLIIHGIDRIGIKEKIKNFKFLKKDLYNIKKNDIPNEKYDYIVHLAGIPSPVFYKKFPLRTIYLNAELSRELLEISKKRKSKLIFFSSSEIYGNPFDKFVPTFENYNGNVSSISDRSCYDESKRMGETYSYIFKEYFNVDVKIIRPFNFYGEGMRQNDERIIPKFFSQIINNKPITVFSNGNQTRTYCHIYDAIVMIVKIMFAGKKFVYNVGNPSEEISALDLANKIKKCFVNKNSKIIKIPYPKNYPSDEPMRRCPSINNFISEFRFKPQIKLSDGLRFFKKYAEKNFIKS